MKRLAEDDSGQTSGFTLVEITVTTLAIGLLASLAAIGIHRGITNARIREATAELSMISSAALQMAWDTGQWPNKRSRVNSGSAEIWDISTGAAGLVGNDGSFTDWKGPYYDGETLDPWGNPYFFDPDFRVEGMMRVVVGSFGPNGKGRNRYDSDDIYVLLDD